MILSTQKFASSTYWHKTLIHFIPISIFREYFRHDIWQLFYLFSIKALWWNEVVSLFSHSLPSSPLASPTIAVMLIHIIHSFISVNYSTSVVCATVICYVVLLLTILPFWFHYHAAECSSHSLHSLSVNKKFLTFPKWVNILLVIHLLQVRSFAFSHRNEAPFFTIYPFRKGRTLFFFG
jgi:hypothetical protein